MLFRSPAGTVAEIRRSGASFIFYVIKQDNGGWRRLTPPFNLLSDDLTELGSRTDHLIVILTILYNPDNDKSQSDKGTTTTINIIQAPNTDIGKQMSLHPEWFHKMSFGDLVSYIANEVTHNNFHEYHGTIYDLPVGTTIQVQFPCSPTMHFVKQANTRSEEPHV